MPPFLATRGSAATPFRHRVLQCSNVWRRQHIALDTGQPRNSVVSDNARGFELGGFGTLSLDIENCLVANNSPLQGIDVTNAGSSVAISNCTMSGNSTGVRMGTGATIFSRGNNTFFGNGTDVVGGLLTPLPAQ